MPFSPLMLVHYAVFLLLFSFTTADQQPLAEATPKRVAVISELYPLRSIIYRKLTFLQEPELLDHPMLTTCASTQNPPKPPSTSPSSSAPLTSVVVPQRSTSSITQPTPSN